MKVKLHMYNDLVISRFHPKYKAAQQFLDSEVLKDSAPYVPMRTGNLMNSGNTGTVIGSGEVIYNAPYAKTCYYAVNRQFSKQKHPQACAQWFEKAKTTHIDSWVKGVQKIIRGG